MNKLYKIIITIAVVILAVLAIYAFVFVPNKTIVEFRNHYRFYNSRISNKYQLKANGNIVFSVYVNEHAYPLSCVIDPTPKMIMYQFMNKAKLSEEDFALIKEKIESINNEIEQDEFHYKYTKSYINENRFTQYPSTSKEERDEHAYFDLHLATGRRITVIEDNYSFFKNILEKYRDIDN